MGLINELHDVKATLNYKEQQKAKKEYLKALEQDYNAEIKGNLQTVFYKLFEKYTTQEAYKIAILEKETIIENITKYIEKITYKKNGKNYYKYLEKFDIVGDLQANYYAELDKIHKEIERIETEQNKILFEKLEKQLHYYYTITECKRVVTPFFCKNENIKAIIEEITKDPTEQEKLYKNYFTILQKVKKYYNGYIVQEQEEIKQQKALARKQKEAEKIARRDRLLTLHIINKWLK